MMTNETKSQPVLLTGRCVTCDGRTVRIRLFSGEYIERDHDDDASAHRCACEIAQFLNHNNVCATASEAIAALAAAGY